MSGTGSFDPNAFIRSAPERPIEVGMPPTWRAGMTALGDTRPPRDLAAARWAELIRDAKRLALSRAAELAIDSGWTLVDVFAFDPVDPGVGLVAAIRGGRVINVTPDYAAITTPHGHRWHYRRHTPPDSPLIWTERGGR